jgi:hypothetical protein
MDSRSESKTQPNIEKTPSVPQQQPQQLTHIFGYNQNHSYRSDSVWESDTSFWDISRHHDLEAEIVVAYHFPDVHRTPRDIPEMATSSYKLKENVANLQEVDEDGFASFMSDKRAEAKRERKERGGGRLEQKTIGYWERRMVYVAYIEQRDAKRKAKEERKKGGSPSHDETRRQKKNFRVKGEVERMRKSIEDKGMEEWEREHCDPGIKEAVRAERRKLHRRAMWS